MYWRFLVVKEVMNLLNDIINIDLHIHSIESEYKEKEGYLNNSTIDNIDVLLKKLNENNINYITDSSLNLTEYVR